MRLKIWRFTTIMLVALSMGMAFGHLLEMPAKMTYNGALWLKLLQTLYWGYGKIGSIIEIAAVVTSIVLTFLVRHSDKAFTWTLLGAFCMVAAHAAWWISVRPVNIALMPLTAGTLPSGWTLLRNQWEYTQAIRALFQVMALGSLVISFLVEIPTGVSSDSSV